MKMIHSLVKRLRDLMIAFCITASMCSQWASANEQSNPESILTTIKIETVKLLPTNRLNGTKGLYSSSANTVTKASLTADEKRKKVTWGISHRGLSILKRF
jgi:hypothetical protein